MKQCFNDSVSQWISKSTKSLNEWTLQPTNQWMNKFSQLELPKVLQSTQFFAIFMWNQALATVSCAFCQLHRPTVLRSTHLFGIFQCKANSTLKCACCSRYSLVHISPTSSFKSVPVPIPSVLFFTIFMWNWARKRVQCTFCRPYLPKVLRPPQFLTIFMCKSSSRYSPVHFLSTTFPDRCRQPWKQRSYFGDRGSHFPWKNTGFRTRECSPVNSHASEFHSSQLLDDEMMMTTMTMTMRMRMMMMMMMWFMWLAW